LRDDTLPPPPHLASPWKLDPIPRSKALIIPRPTYDENGSEGKEVFKAQPRPERTEAGTMIFEGRWKGIFTPNVTPEEMFAGGAFGGSFFG
jgi:hypothetical protein